MKNKVKQCSVDGCNKTAKWWVPSWIENLPDSPMCSDHAPPFDSIKIERKVEDDSFDTKPESTP